MTLEVDRHEAFRRREHAVTSVGWVVMGALVLAGLFGFVGPGPWSESTERSPGGAVEVGYLRVAHIEADDSLTLTFSPDAVEDGTIVADLTGPWVAGVDRQGITPTPSEETLIPGGVRLEFPAATTTGDPGEALEVAILFRAQELWSLPGRLDVAGETAEFSQFVLP